MNTQARTETPEESDDRQASSQFLTFYLQDEMFGLEIGIVIDSVSEELAQLEPFAVPA